MEPDASKGTRKTTKTSLEILDAINDLDHATLTELSEYTSLPTSTLYTHLQTLENMEIIKKLNGEYHIGLRVFHYGENARYRDERYRKAKAKAYELANQVGEEVSFSVEEYGRSIVLFDETSTPSEDGYQVGRYFHMHSSASGKAMLAAFSNSRVEKVIEKWGLPRHTDNTITDFDELLNELTLIRDQGYAVNRGEELEGLRSVGMVVRNPDDSVFGSIDISGPPYRLPDGEELADQLSPVVQGLEEELLKNSA